MATIQAIEAQSVHQIQSGQVIVDLCSVVKELVENSLDAGATSIEVRFKNNGLESIEVQDNGTGIAAANYHNVALKHFTSKLSNYDDLSTLETFGFRGEALSSLCALSHFSIVTAQADEVPKGTRLEFELSGALKSTSTTACQRGTTALVESLFEKLPVRRKELSKNIKREYGKVLGLLHAYACIGANVKFTVKNAMPKAKSVVVFSTKGNATTRENIANVYGAKTLQALAPLNLDLDFQPAQKQMGRSELHTSHVKVVGHISRPVFGEGRQTPDRQMFFVNGRPCGLPQIAKAVNEVYKSFNVSQSPFIFADFIMDTNAYDVNVSPDKRSVMLHNAATLIERLKTCLTVMFDEHEQTVPQSQLPTAKLPAFRQLTVQRQASDDSAAREQSRRSSVSSNTSPRSQGDATTLDNVGNDDGEKKPKRLMHDHFRAQASTREELDLKAQEKVEARLQKDREHRAERVAGAVFKQAELNKGIDEYDDVRETQESESPHDDAADPQAIRVRDFNARMAEQQSSKLSDEEDQPTEQPIPALLSSPAKEPRGVVQNAFDRIRPKKTKAEIASITIDGETTTTVIGSQLPRATGSKKEAGSGKMKAKSVLQKSSVSQFSQSIRKFGAPGTQVGGVQDEPSEESDDADELLSKRPTEGEGARSDEDLSSEESAMTNSGAEETIEDAGDSDYVDETETKVEEDARVAELIRQAEESAAIPTKENIRRANKAMKGGQTKDSTFSFLTSVESSLEQLQTQMDSLQQAMQAGLRAEVKQEKATASAKDEELRLSLSVSKGDFARMDIVGQFNLGFILAVRPKTGDDEGADHSRDELFIIDQHASDEKFNFERLQAETVIGNQRMVRPVNLSLTAVEEEILLENTGALEKSGFVIEIDTSGASPVGRRCTLTSLPLSKETTFDTRDMDELIHMLSESPMLGAESTVPRPSRVRKMFAMRACRSSIMIGKTLSRKQMKMVVTHMGTIDKPWNCPHGRPTMRHLTSLDGMSTWQEGDGVAGLDEDADPSSNIWHAYIES